MFHPLTYRSDRISGLFMSFSFLTQRPGSWCLAPPRGETTMHPVVRPFLLHWCHDEPARQHDQTEQCIRRYEHPLGSVEVNQLAHPVSDKRAGVRDLSRGPTENAFPNREGTHHAYPCLHCYDGNGHYVSDAEPASAYPRPTSKRPQQDASLAPDNEGNKKEMNHKDSICQQRFHALHCRAERFGSRFAAL